MVVPAGRTYSFLFTDIQGSTELAELYPQAMPSLFFRHNAILDEAFTENHGTVFHRIGDAFCAVFETADDALHAAISAQSMLQKEPWSPVPILVRMGIHCGPASPAEIDSTVVSFGGYLTLTRVQRIMSTAHVGQILISSTVVELLRGRLPEQVVLRDLGEHRLKGLTQPEHLWQIICSGLISEFPPLQTLAAVPNNLPMQLSSFIGRKREIDEIKSWLDEFHLIMLTGPGGTGKTRLSLQVAGDLLDLYTDGVWLVELAPLAEPLLVPQIVSEALVLREQPGRPILAQLVDYLRPKKLLLVLDNCEHLIEACAQLAGTLLQACPHLRILASSREPLGITGEISYPVLSLQTPPVPTSSTAAQLMKNESALLFVEPAQIVQPHFSLSDANAPAVAQICRRLDGIPLAIELAAARIKFFTPEQIAARLDDRFRLLTGGSRTNLPRQQTLHALIEWSYDLLSQPEAVLFRRLSIFAGGWIYEAAEQVCSNFKDTEVMRLEIIALDILEILPQLVNKSLVMTDKQGSEIRYHFLETIRQFAQQKLHDSGETEQIRDRHLDYYLTLVQHAEPGLRGQEQVYWLDRFDTEEDNLRSAIDWALKSGQMEKALSLVGSIWWFWYARDHFSEAFDRTHAALQQSVQAAPGEARIKVLIGLGFLQYAANHMEEARAILVEAVSLSQQLRFQRGLAEALQFLGATEYEIARETDHEFSYVREIMQECLETWKQLKDPTDISWELNLMANLYRAEGDLPKARSLLEESAALRRKIGDRILLAYTLRRLADIAIGQGDFSAAEAASVKGIKCF